MKDRRPCEFCGAPGNASEPLIEMCDHNSDDFEVVDCHEECGAAAEFERAD